MGAKVSSLKPCVPGTLDTCAECARPMHRGSGGSCREGHLRHGARSLCTGCTTAARRAGQTPTEPDPAVDLIRWEWPHFHGRFGYSVEQVAARLKLPVATVRRVVSDLDTAGAA